MDALNGSVPHVALTAGTESASAAVVGADSPLERLISEKEAAHILGLAQQTLVAGRFRGAPILPWVQVNRRVLYRPSDIRAFIARNLHGAKAA